MDSFDDIRFNREYVFYIIAEKTFAATIKDKFKQFLSKFSYPLDSEEPDFTPVKLSPTGERPATHFGTRLQIRGREGKKLARYASNQSITDINVWMLDPLDEEKPLWTRKNGFGPFVPEGWTYRRFIKEIDSPLKVIRD